MLQNNMLGRLHGFRGFVLIEQLQRKPTRSRSQQPVGLALSCQESTTGSAVMRWVRCLPCKQQHWAALAAHRLCKYADV